MPLNRFLLKNNDCIVSSYRICKYIKSRFVEYRITSIKPPNLYSSHMKAYIRSTGFDNSFFFFKTSGWLVEIHWVFKMEIIGRCYGEALYSSLYGKCRHVIIIFINMSRW